MKNSKNKLFIYSIVFITGLIFLLLEISWVKLLSVRIGNTIFANTIVISTYMAGLGLGARFWGRYIRLKQNLYQLLAKLLIATGFFIITNYIFLYYGIIYIYDLTVSFSTITRELLVFVLSSVSLFSVTFFMGGVMPIASQINSQENTLSSNISSIYGFETLGSTIGGLLTGFILIGYIGLQNTIIFGLVIILILAISLLFYSKSNKIKYLNTIRETTNNQTTNKNNELKKMAIYIAISSGFIVMSMQLLWFRFFRIYLTNTNYTFSLIASFVIIGYFIGSFLHKKKSRAIHYTQSKAINLLLILILLVIGGLYFLYKMPLFLMVPLQNIFSSYITRLVIIPTTASILVILPVSIMSGFIMPYSVTLYSSESSNAGQSFGDILFANTIGSIIGPLLSGFVLIPIFGVAKAALIIVGIVLICIVWHLYKHKTGVKFHKIIAISLLTMVIGLTVLPNIIKIMPPSFTINKKHILFYKESTQGTVVVGQEKENGLNVKSTFVNNASVIGSSYDAIKAVKMVGHMPFFAGLKCKNALIVGFGIGVTTSSIAMHKEIKSIDCVELMPGLKEASILYKNLNMNVSNDSRLHFINGDGRHYLQICNKKYDFISSDPTHPILGSGNLYTKEYFELYKKHLTQNGMVSQYLPLHKLTRKYLLGLMKTFSSVFPNSVVWLGHYHAILMGSNNPIRINFKNWVSEINNLEKDKYFYTNPYHLAANLILDSKKIKQLSKKININTDNLSYVDYFNFNCFNADNLPNNLKFLNNSRIDIKDVFYNIPDNTLMEKFIQGNKTMTNGIEAMLRHNKRNLYYYLKEAVKINPEDQEFPFLLKLYFNQ